MQCSITVLDYWLHFIAVNKCQQIPCTHTFYFLRSKHGDIYLTSCTNYRAKTGNDGSKFMHSNWITQSYL